MEDNVQTSNQTKAMAMMFGQKETAARINKAGFEQWNAKNPLIIVRAQRL